MALSHGLLSPYFQHSVLITFWSQLPHVQVGCHYFPSLRILSPAYPGGGGTLEIEIQLWQFCQHQFPLFKFLTPGSFRTKLDLFCYLDPVLTVVERAQAEGLDSHIGTLPLPLTGWVPLSKSTPLSDPQMGIHLLFKLI